MSSRKMPPLSPEEEKVIRFKWTEAPFKGAYTDNKQSGTYVCRACGLPLYGSSAKFDSGCGWPSFDHELDGAVERRPDPDGMRTEIVCSNCGGHLGHVFSGEGFTPKDTRHCVNSISMKFIADGEPWPEVEWSEHRKREKKIQSAVFAGGCFWGLEHAFSRVPGVLDAVSGYSGGELPNPSYEQVCSGRTGHAEAVRVDYDPAKVSYEQLARLFFELHDPTEINRQGLDIGTQYRSALFYGDEEEKRIALRLVDQLKANGYAVVTQILPAAPFYPAEEYHQDYLKKNLGRGCQLPVKRFEIPAG